MTPQEAKQAIEELKAQGNSEEDIVGVLYLMFQDDKLTVEELGDMVQLCGYELSDEFKAMSPEDQKTKGFEQDENAAADGVSEEEVEDAKETPAGGEDEEDTSNDTSSDEEENDDAKAAKLFGFGK